MRPPLRYIDGNILFGQDGEVSAIYRLPSVSYPFLPRRDKRRWMLRLDALAKDISANFSVYRVPRAWASEDHLAGLHREDHHGREVYLSNLDLIEPEHGDRDTWAEHLREDAYRMDGMHAHTPEVYLAVSLTPARRKRFFSSAAASTGETHRLLTELFGLAAPRPVAEKVIDELRAEEQRLGDKVIGWFAAARPASTDELQWLFARSGTRGVGEPMLDQQWRPDALRVEGGRYRPTGAELVRLINAHVTERDGLLHVQHNGTHSYQAFVCLGGQPEHLVFPGIQAELFYAPIEALQFPVDVVAHFTFIVNAEARSTAGKKVLTADNNAKEEDAGLRGASYRTQDTQRVAREFEERVGAPDAPPILQCRISYAVGGRTPQEAQKRADALLKAFGPGFTLYRPTGLQEKLWLDHLPRTDGGRVRDYEGHWMTEQFGAAMPIGTQEVGTPTGAYFGATTSGGHRPVFYDPTYASRNNKPPAIVVTGTLGSGKTMACQVMGYIAHKRGSLVITVDPKPDHSLHLLDDMDMTVVELSGNPRYRGLLDPLRFGNRDIRGEMTWSFLMDILGEPKYSTVVRGAVRRVMEQPDPRLERVVDVLKAGDTREAQTAGSDLEEWSLSGGVVSLAFGGDNTPEINATDGVTFRFPDGGGLVLPSREKDRREYTGAERINVSILGLAAAYATNMAADASRHAYVLLDEAWALYQTSMGRGLVDRLLRLGRSQLATLVLSTQSPADLADAGVGGEVAEFVGTHMVFGMKTRKAAMAALQLIGLDSTDNTLVERIMEYADGDAKGLALMRDNSGHVAEIQVDAGVLLDRLSTTSGRG